MSRIQSMTGYGRSARKAPTGNITVELRSTNHRYLEIEQRLPNGFASMQGAIGELIRSHVKRGRIEALILIQSAKTDQRRIVFDESLLERYYAALVQLKARFGLKGHIGLEHILALPHAVTVTEERLQSDRLWEAVRTTSESAMKQLVAARQREGRHLVADLQIQIRAIRQSLKAIRRRLPKATEHQRAHLRTRLKELMGSSALSTVGRLEEIVALVKDVDVNEEMVRLESHLGHIEERLSGNQPVGKQLDFIAQELMREANTMGAKVNDPIAAHHVVEIKGRIEKIREQVQNLE